MKLNPGRCNLTARNELVPLGAREERLRAAASMREYFDYIL